MKILTKSKRSMESDTATRSSSNRWFRVSTRRSEIEHLFDLYWGGEERRITGMTLRILGVNVIALIALIFGVVYLGQYHNALVEAKLERFETEILLVTSAVSESYLPNTSKNSANKLSGDFDRFIGRLSTTVGKRIIVFDRNGEVLSDSAQFETELLKPIVRIMKPEKKKFQSIQLLKDMANIIVAVLPFGGDKLSPFPNDRILVSRDFKDVAEALQKHLSFSVWKGDDDRIVLTAAMPVWGDVDLEGAVLLVSENEEIKEELADMWFSVLKIFLVTLAITVFLSIYLSGVIARPLRKLSNAAEKVRRGKMKYTDIPDMSDRHDEIGELSVVLRDMTQALWERMDTIEAFAADVAHEIKNPLTSLKSAVETACAVKKKEDMTKLLGVIQHDIERLDRLITDISKASRLDAELSREDFEIIDLKVILHSLFDIYKGPLDRENFENGSPQNRMVKDGVVIILDLPEKDNVYVSGSETRLLQVFDNILSNAISFSKVGSTIKIKLSVKANRAMVIIDDEGSGIPDGKLKAIFERFYSERPQHEEYGRHSGLGLSICHQIIAAHGGVIYAENRYNRSNEIKGARFIVILNMNHAAK